MRNRTRRLLLVSLVAIMSSVSRFADADPTVPGAAVPEGVFGSGKQGAAGNADSTGAFSFSVPLDLPRGRGGVGPRLSLGYHSSSKSGNAGYGWNLRVPSIERSPLSGNPVFDGSPSDLAFRERFTYGGTLLVLVCQAGQSLGCSTGGEVLPGWAAAGGWSYFRAQVEDGTPARFFLSADRTTWRVQMKGGVLLTFGADENAIEQESGPGTEVRWHLTSEVDARNPVEYARDRAEYRWQKLGSRGHSYLCRRQREIARG